MEFSSVFWLAMQLIAEQTSTHPRQKEYLLGDWEKPLALRPESFKGSTRAPGLGCKPTSGPMVPSWSFMDSEARLGVPGGSPSD